MKKKREPSKIEELSEGDEQMSELKPLLNTQKELSRADLISENDVKDTTPKSKNLRSIEPNTEEFQNRRPKTM